MRALLVIVLVSCGAPAPRAPAQNTAPRGDDPLAKLRTFETAMCACLAVESEVEGSGVDETCSAEAARPVNAWVGDGTSWKRTLTDDQVAEATAILDRIRRCFQAGIGDPLPPRRAHG